jgi:hypothetical protein
MVFIFFNQFITIGRISSCICDTMYQCCRFFYESERGLFPNTEFVYDLELPLDFVPNNSDGEVESFELLPAKVS